LLKEFHGRVTLAGGMDVIGGEWSWEGGPTDCR